MHYHLTLRLSLSPKILRIKNYVGMIQIGNRSVVVMYFSLTTGTGQLGTSRLGMVVSNRNHTSFVPGTSFCDLNITDISPIGGLHD